MIFLQGIATNSDNLGGEAAVHQCQAAVDHVTLFAALDDVLALVMDDPGALLRLCGGMFADLDQALDHPIKGIHIVIEQNDAVCLGYYRLNRFEGQLFDTHLTINYKLSQNPTHAHHWREPKIANFRHECKKCTKIAAMAKSAKIQIFTPSQFLDHELIDAGGGEKLERFGKFVLIRPEPQALWAASLSPEEWRKMAHARFVQDGSASGDWERYDSALPDQWTIGYTHGDMKLRFRLGLTRFKHVGVFPEQAVNWDFIHDRCKALKAPKVLNLFAYTGGASLAAKAGGADVIHCDAIKQVVNWAAANMELSKLDGIRWLVEDAFKFVQREAKRGNQYDGIILDPPAWGHGPKGEKWKLEDQINELMQQVAAILAPEKSFLVMNAYSLGYSSLILENLGRSHFSEAQLKNLEIGELCLTERSGRRLPAGVFMRFWN